MSATMGLADIESVYRKAALSMKSQDQTQQRVPAVQKCEPVAWLMTFQRDENGELVSVLATPQKVGS